MNTILRSRFLASTLGVVLLVGSALATRSRLLRRHRLRGGGHRALEWERRERQQRVVHAGWSDASPATATAKLAAGFVRRGGIGANVIVPIYHSDDKHFSTEFNFGDHLAIGRQFGDHREQEIALRLQHFSNAGIREPNPGENFQQLRYLKRF